MRKQGLGEDEGPPAAAAPPTDVKRPTCSVVHFFSGCRRVDDAQFYLERALAADRADAPVLSVDVAYGARGDVGDPEARAV